MIGKSKKIRISHQKGLTLVEVAIVLVILGLLIGLGASLIGPLTKRAKITETKENLNANVEAIISWAAGNKRLPKDSEFVNVIRNRNDSWGKPFYYVVDSNLVQETLGTEHRICNRRTTNITVRVYQDVNNYQDITNIAFLMISGGGNYNNQTAGTQLINNPTTIVIQYPDADNIDNYSGDFSRPESYDDILKWITLDELRIKVGCQGAPLRILNNQLISGIKDHLYEAKIIADGGVTFPDGSDTGDEREYEWCVETRGGTKPANLTFRTTYGEEIQLNDFTKNTALDPNSPDRDYRCLTTTDQNDWKRSDYLKLEGTPSSSYSDSVIIYVRDNQSPSKNIAFKQFTLEISDSGSGQQSSSAPPGSQVSFANNIGQFQTTENNSNAVSVVGNTVIFGGSTNNTSGCFWFPSSYQLSGKTMRAFFKFKFLTIDTSSNSRQYADGFTFAVVTSNMPNSACGGLGVNIGFGGLGYDSVALEVDTYPNTGSWRYDPANNHVAIVKNGNNSHSDSNPSCQSQGCVAGANATWLEDGVEHPVRVEILTGCDQNCNNCSGHPENYALFKAWINCTDNSCRDLTQSYISTSTVEHCFQLPISMSSVKFGFTEGTGGAVQQLEIRDFGIGFF